MVFLPSPCHIKTEDKFLKDGISLSIIYRTSPKLSSRVSDGDFKVDTRTSRGPNINID